MNKIYDYYYFNYVSDYPSLLPGRKKKKPLNLMSLNIQKLRFSYATIRRSVYVLPEQFDFDCILTKTNVP